MTVVSCRQLAPVIGDLDANRALAVTAIQDAVADGCDVIVLPELMTSGYVFSSAEEAHSLAIPADHHLFDAWSASLGESGGVVIGGFAELGDDDQVYNSAAIVDSTGVLAVYRKLHLWDREKLFFTPGSALPPVVKTRHGRIAVVICYDLEFPELTRTVALSGADLLAVPTNWPLGTYPNGEHVPEVVIAMAAARTNRMAIACCDRTGVERGQDWMAGTAVISELGWVLASAAENGFATADLDLTAGRDKKLGEYAHALKDRRPELYRRVAEEA